MTKRLVDVDDADERVEDVIHQLGVVTELVFLEPTSWKMMRSRGSRRISSGLFCIWSTLSASSAIFTEEPPPKLAWSALHPILGALI